MANNSKHDVFFYEGQRKTCEKEEVEEMKTVPIKHELNYI